MTTKPNLIKRMMKTLEQQKHAILALSVFLFILVTAFVMQLLAIKGSLPPIATSGPQDYQMAKLVA